MPLTKRLSNYNLRSNRTIQVEQEANIDTNEGVLEVPIPQSYNIASVIRLKNIKGDSSQDIRSFLKRFEQYKGCTGINEEQGLATLAWHLEGTARLWFESLDPQPTTEKRLNKWHSFF